MITAHGNSIKVTAENVEHMVTNQPTRNVLYIKKVKRDKKRKRACGERWYLCIFNV